MGRGHDRLPAESAPEDRDEARGSGDEGDGIRAVESSLDEELARCRQWLQDALDHAGGTHSIEDIEDQIRKGLVQFWPGKRSACVTEIIIYPQRRVLHLFLAGGDLEEIREMETCATWYAERMGCSAMTICGRRGWAKALADKGYREYLTTIIKPIEPVDFEVYNTPQEV